MGLRDPRSAHSGGLPYGILGVRFSVGLLALRRWGIWFKRSPISTFGDDKKGGEWGSVLVEDSGEGSVAEVGEE